MLAPLSWLKDFVDIDVTVEELEKKLFDSGFEVEQIIPYGDKLDKVVTCKIFKIEQHPNAEKLRICQVDAGKYGKLQIITNAQNVKEGDIVPVAVDGATLATGDRIFNGKLRGEPSYGMFCGGEEIGITDAFYEGASFDGVLVFNDDFPLGEEVRDLLGLKDYVFDISVLANRPDCQSIVGIAREIACALNKPFKEPDLSYNEVKGDDEKIDVTVLDNELCPRYIAHLIKDVKIEKAPKWMSKRLALCGLNSINNIVDITNYVLLEMGQPMHAFDLKDLENNEIIVRRAENGEKIVTLDEKENILNSDNLVICDGQKPVALAGIMGGLNSEIKDDTTAVLFECAKFKRDNVRKSARTLGKSSDSSKRFEKGVDEYTTERASKRALNLIDKLGAGRVTAVRVDVSAGKTQENKEVRTTFGKINGVLGIEVPKDTIVDILTRLGFGVTVDGENLVTVAPPYREDVEGYPDLAEEVIRTYGYEHIKPTLLKEAQVTAGGYSKEQKDELKMKRTFVNLGFNEAMTFSFYSKKDISALNLREGDCEGQTILIGNPLSDNYEVLRRTLIPSLLKVASSNIKKGNTEGKIFEIARTFIPKTLPVTDFPEERRYLTALTFGGQDDFFTLKGVLEEIAEIFRVKFNLNVRADKTYLHSGVSAKILLGDKEIGVYGQIAYETAAAFDIECKVYALELDYDALAEEFNTPFKYVNLPKFRSVERDLALVADEKTTCAEIEDVIRSACKNSVESVKLFDVYVGEQVGVGKKSMAYTVTFKAGEEKPLESADVDAFVKRILGSLKHRLGVELR
ncbi:MAG: phenylalanine--tRNA ligase subunit beta [Clostridiales bacterium]|nr:phenylalanine--tRNA ligase subunit beta [Clostridiales bacterium]